MVTKNIIPELNAIDISEKVKINLDTLHKTIASIIVITFEDI